MEQRIRFGALPVYERRTILYTDRALSLIHICLFSVAAGAAAFCLALLLKEEKRNVSQSGATVPQLLQVCRGRRILVFSLIALIQQGIQLTTAMSFTSQILKDCGASDSLVGISSIIYMVSAVCFSAMASSKLCEKHGPKFWIPAVLAVLAVYCILAVSYTHLFMPHRTFRISGYSLHRSITA